MTIKTNLKKEVAFVQCEDPTDKCTQGRSTSTNRHVPLCTPQALDGRCYSPAEAFATGLAQEREDSVLRTLSQEYK